jgi:hypothetical protein
MMTELGVHWLDIVQMAFDEAMPRSVAAMGGKLWFNRQPETPDTLQVNLRVSACVPASGPAGDIENCFRSTSTCLLGSQMRLDWDARELAAAQEAARGFLRREYRAALEVGCLSERGNPATEAVTLLEEREDLKADVLVVLAGEQVDRTPSFAFTISLQRAE